MKHFFKIFEQVFSVHHIYDVCSKLNSSTTPYRVICLTGFSLNISAEQDPVIMPKMKVEPSMIPQTVAIHQYDQENNHLKQEVYDIKPKDMYSTSLDPESEQEQGTRKKRRVHGK